MYLVDSCQARSRGFFHSDHHCTFRGPYGWERSMTARVSWTRLHVCGASRISFSAETGFCQRGTHATQLLPRSHWLCSLPRESSVTIRLTLISEHHDRNKSQARRNDAEVSLTATGKELVKYEAALNQIPNLRDSTR